MQDTTHLIQTPCYTEEVCAKILQATGPHKDLLTTIKRCKAKWYGHVSHSSGLAKIILQGTVKGKEDKADRRRGQQTNQEMDRPGVCQVPEGSREHRKMKETGCEIICGAPTTLVVKG